MKLSGGKQSEHSARAPKAPKAQPKRSAAASGAEKARGGSSGRVVLIVVLALIAAVMAAAAAGVAYVGRIGTIFPNVSIDGIDVGNLTVEQTAQRLTEHGYAVIGDEAIDVSLPLDVAFTVRADEVCTDTPAADIARMAYTACKGGSHSHSWNSGAVTTAATRLNGAAR